MHTPTLWQSRQFGLFGLMIVALLVAAWLPAQRAAAQTPSVEQVLATYGPYDTVVVQVFFTDERVARRISATYEPRESRYEAGYLVLQEQQQEILRLLQLREQLAITVVVDELATLEEQQKASGLIPEKKSRQRLSDSQTSERQSAALNFVGIPGFACYRTVEETFASAADIVLNYPGLATWTDVGDSWERVSGFGGYDLNVLRLTNLAIAGPKPTIFITSAIHAREYTTAELMTRFAEQLVAEYGSDADTTWILDHTDIRLMLVANPDGRKQAEAGILWRKNTNQNYCSPTSSNRGADLNRNFTYEWNCCGGSSGNECATTYRGSFAASEPETQAVIGQLASIFPDRRGPGVNDPAPLDTSGMYLDIHSSGRLILWPWGFTSNPAPNATQLQTLGRKLAFFNGHTPQQSIGLYPTDGTTTSYGYGELGLPSFTYELGTAFFESCSYFENTLLPDNIPSLKYALKVVRAPYLLPAGPEGYGVSLAPTGPSGVPAGTQVDLQVTFDDTRYNNSNGTEPTQAVAAAEYYIDVPPWEPGASAFAVSMSAADFSFDSGVEEARATIDTTSLSEGRHTVFARAQDSLGNWGVVSAAFLDIDNNAVLPTVLFEDDFESDLGWVANPGGSDTASTGQWQRADPEQTSSGGIQQLGSTVSGSFDLVTGPLAGTSVGTHDIDNGVTSIRSPDIAIPANASAVELRFYAYLAHLNNATNADFLRVSVVGSVSGAQQVFEELGDPNQDNAAWVQTTVALDSFAGETVYLLLEAADAAGGSLVEAAVDDVTITAIVPGGGNTAPAVDAGAPLVINFPAAASLNASIVDDGLPDPPGAVVSTWSVVAGPGSVTFGDVNAAATSVSFGSSGLYTLRITADDGELQSSDEIEVTANAAPSVDAGPDQGVTLPAGAALAATVSDDGLPAPGSVSTMWSAVSGPGPVTFGDAGALATGAAFSVPGTYVLRITADDGAQLASDDIQVTVAPAPNQPPIVDAGSDQTVVLPAGASLDASASDDGLPNPPGALTTTWSVVSGPGTVTFANPGAEDTTADFSSAGVYVLRLSADDGAFVVADEVQVTVSDAPANQPPVVDAGADQTLTLPAAASLSGSVSDDGLPNPPGLVTSAWSVVSGPGAVAFGDASAATTDATFSAAGVYLLRLSADDSALSASDVVQITADPPGVCPSGSLDFNQLTLQSYSNQDVSGGAVASGDGSTLTLTGNAWKRSAQSFTLTPNSVIEFEYASASQGEIHGLGFDADQTLNNDPRLFQFWGTQNWTGGGAINYSPKYTGGGDFQSFSIAVGNYYSGSDLRLVFVNDKDAGTPDNEGVFRCVRVVEQTPISCAIEETFSAGDGGWSNSPDSTCSTGAYVVGTPTQVVNGGVTTQVGGDHTSGSGGALFSAVNTSAGSNDIDNGECIVESPVYAVNADSELSLWYFHGQRDAGDDPSGDYFDLELSLDGGASWSTLASNGDQTSNAVWSEVTATVPAGSSVRLRMGASDGAGSGDLVEAGVDDLRICVTP